MCKEVPLRAIEAMAVELGVCGFYFKPFENKLMYQCRPPPPGQFAHLDPAHTT